LFIILVNVVQLQGGKNMSSRSQLLIQEAAHCFDEQEDERALELIEEAIQQDANNIEAHLMKGIITYDMEMYNEAKHCFEKVLEQDPHHAFALNYLGELNLNIDDDPEKAITVFDKVLEMNPEATDIVFNKGICYLHMGEIEKAIEQFHRAQQMDPDDEDTKNILHTLTMKG